MKEYKHKRLVEGYFSDTETDDEIELDKNGTVRTYQYYLATKIFKPELGLKRANRLSAIAEQTRFIDEVSGPLLFNARAIPGGETIPDEEEPQYALQTDEKHMKYGECEKCGIGFNVKDGNNVSVQQFIRFAKMLTTAMLSDHRCPSVYMCAPKFYDGWREKEFNQMKRIEGVIWLYYTFCWMHKQKTSIFEASAYASGLEDVVSMIQSAEEHNRINDAYVSQELVTTVFRRTENCQNYS